MNIPGLDSTVAGPNSVSGTTTTVLADGILTAATGLVASVATVPIAQGGTGAATQAAALAAILGSNPLPVANGGTGVAAVADAYAANHASPTGTASVTAVMMGLNGSITPVKPTSRVLFLVSGGIGNSAFGAGQGATAQLRYGTGAAPGNGDAGTAGTAIGLPISVYSWFAGSHDPFSIGYIATGLTQGTPYWFDVSLLALVNGTATIINVNMVAIEL